MQHAKPPRARGGLAYRKENIRLRKVFRACSYTEADRIRFAVGCTFRDAWVIETLRKWASPLLVDKWATGLCYFRPLWRIVTDHPGDFASQEQAYAERPRRRDATMCQFCGARTAAKRRKCCPEGRHSDYINRRIVERAT